MDIEFHYYMTYLIATRAGFSPADAALLAQAAQEIDDNHIPITVSAATPAAYKSTLSQTMDILRPQHDERIYPIFHFIPGDPAAPSARRKDGHQSPWVTTPNSVLANAMLDTALKSKNLYRIGASAHAFADTWAHQNFLGIDDAFNEMPADPNESLVERIMEAVPVMRIGHALAKHQPDIPDLIWSDGRLANPSVTNAERFLDAADKLFRKFRSYCKGTAADAVVEQEAAGLTADLKADIGPLKAVSAPAVERIARYKSRALLPAYGHAAIPEYVEGKWADAAFVENRSEISTRFAAYVAEHGGIAGDALDFGTSMQCTWRDPSAYRTTAWYLFQEAVKSHLDECWAVLQTHLPGLRAGG